MPVRSVYADCPRHGRVIAEATFADEPIGPAGERSLLELRCPVCVSELAARAQVDGAPPESPISG